MAHKSRKDDILYIFSEYPHRLMQHILSFLQTEKKEKEWLLEQEFFEKYAVTYADCPKEIHELQIVKEKKLFWEFYEKRRAPEWKKRVFIQTSLKNLISVLKEYEAVELLESLMWIFGWNLSVEIRRTWSVPEEEKAKFHDFDKSGFDVRGKNSFHEEMKKRLSKQKEEKSKSLTEEGERTESTGKLELSGFGKEEGFAENRTSFGKKTLEKQSLSEASSLDKGEKNKAADSVQENKTASGVRIVQEISGILSLTEETYQSELKKIMIKHENLMSLSVRKEIKKARQGKVLSQTRLAEFYAEEGTKHTDYEEAAKWYGFAARKGGFQAKFALGKLFDSGKLGKGEVKERGIHYFRELAEEGYPTAQSILGMKYFLGDGVEKNMTEAVKWLKKAAAQGQEDAKRQLDKILKSRGIEGKI